MKRKILQSTQKTRVIICCISSMFKAQIAIQYSACTIGLVSAMPGSLNTDKIVEAITQVRPFGVDVWSRVRMNGQLDERKIVNLNV